MTAKEITGVAERLVGVVMQELVGSLKRE